VGVPRDRRRARSAPKRLQALGAEAIEHRARVATISRALTHRDVELNLHRYAASGRLQGRWVLAADLATAGMPAAFAALLGERK